MSITMNLRNDQREILRDVVLQNGHNEDYYIRLALDMYLEDIKDMFLAKTISSKIISGEEKVWQASDVRRILEV